MTLLNNPRYITVEYTLTNGIFGKKILKMAFLNNPRMNTVKYTRTKHMQASLLAKSIVNIFQFWLKFVLFTKNKVYCLTVWCCE